MRINRFVARATGLSRRAADQTLSEGRIMVNGRPAAPGTVVTDSDTVTLDGRTLTPTAKTRIILLNKPAGYVCSRAGQGSSTIYDLLPDELHHLKPAGRLDKDSSGLLVLTDDGELANRLTHPRYGKDKVYEVILDKPLTAGDRRRAEQGVKLGDGLSRLRITGPAGDSFTVIMREGRNRQIRRTFQALGYQVRKLHRIRFGRFTLGGLRPGATAEAAEE